MSDIEQIKEALNIDFEKNEDPKSRLIICIKRKVNEVDLDNGHFGLICAHSTAIAFNAWDGNDKIIFGIQTIQILFLMKILPKKILKSGVIFHLESLF